MPRHARHKADSAITWRNEAHTFHFVLIIADIVEWDYFI